MNLQETPLPHLEFLYCKDEYFDDDDLGEECEKTILSPYEPFDVGDYDEKMNLPPYEPFIVGDDVDLLVVVSKEEQLRPGINKDASLLEVRRSSVSWVLRASARYGFSVLTSVLAVNYIDRFISNPAFQREIPWMGQLTAVTCLSLAAKVEETQAPLLVDLQTAEGKYEFETKAIQRMELLVLSTLNWKMNPVTPFSFVDLIVRRLGIQTRFKWDCLFKFERILLYIIADSRFLYHLPSEISAAIMLHIIKEYETHKFADYQKQLMGFLNLKEDNMNKCYGLILDAFNNNNLGLKRKGGPMPGSPKAVVDAAFSCYNSDDSFDSMPVVLSSPHQLLKKCRAIVDELESFT